MTKHSPRPLLPRIIAIFLTAGTLFVAGSGTAQASYVCGSYVSVWSTCWAGFLPYPCRNDVWVPCGSQAPR